MFLTNCKLWTWVCLKTWYSNIHGWPPILLVLGHPSFFIPYQVPIPEPQKTKPCAKEGLGVGQHVVLRATTCSPPKGDIENIQNSVRIRTPWFHCPRISWQFLNAENQILCQCTLKTMGFPNANFEEDNGPSYTRKPWINIGIPQKT
jgi:hypothetical protein